MIKTRLGCASLALFWTRLNFVESRPIHYGIIHKCRPQFSVLPVIKYAFLWVCVLTSNQGILMTYKDRILVYKNSVIFTAETMEKFLSGTMWLLQIVKRPKFLFFHPQSKLLSQGETFSSLRLRRNVSVLLVYNFNFGCLWTFSFSSGKFYRLWDRYTNSTLVEKQLPNKVVQKLTRGFAFTHRWAALVMLYFELACFSLNLDKFRLRWKC